MKGFSNKEREEAAQAIFVAAEVEKTWQRCGHFTDGTQAGLYRKQADACLEVAFATMYQRIKELGGAGPIVGFNNTCEFCKFSQANGNKLRCQRHPPTVIFNPQRELGSRIWSHFPKVSKDDWCGEWQYSGAEE